MSDPHSRGRILFWLLSGGLLLCLLLVIPSAAKFHGDERFYTDAALQMTQTGDYWTPRYADGQIRLLKPILAYWAAAASFRVMGVSLFAARLPFALAGVLVVVVTWFLAQTMWRDRRLALLAASIMASNIALLTLATRATPDVLVILFVLVSMWGFARLWFLDDRTLLAPLLAYGGMGLAVQCKGFLGLCPLAANALFWLLARPERVPLRRLLHGPAILLGVVLGAFWFGVMLQRHGLDAMQANFEDQVGARVAHHPGFIFVNFTNYLFAIFRHALPWTLLLLAGVVWRPRALVAFWRAHRRECLYLVSLAVVLVIFFTFGNIRRTRYLAASYPLVSVLMAGLLSAFVSDARFQRWARKVVGMVAALAMAGGVLLALIGLGGAWELAAGGMALLAFGWAGLRAARAAEDEARWTWVAGLSVLAFMLAGASIRPVFSPSPMSDVMAALNAEATGIRSVSTLGVTDSAAGELRLLSGGGIAVRELTGPAEVHAAVAAGPLLVTSEHREGLETAGFLVRSVPEAQARRAGSRLLDLAYAQAARSRGTSAATYWLVTQPPAR